MKVSFTRRRSATVSAAALLALALGVGVAAPASSADLSDCVDFGPSTCLYGLTGYESGSQGWAAFKNAYADLGDFDNKTSSVYAFDDCASRTYEYTNYDGRSLYWDHSSDVDLTDNGYPGGGSWNNRISSGKDLC